MKRTMLICGRSLFGFAVVVCFLVGSVVMPVWALDGKIPAELHGLISFLDGQARASGGLARRLSSHPGFQAFLSSSKGDAALDRTASDTAGALPSEEVIARYFETSFRRLAEPETLRARQAEALRVALWHHGWTESGTADGYVCLARLSAANRDRLLNLPRLHVPSIEIEQLVSSIRPVFIHNTNLLERIPEIPLVSSKEIRRTAGVGGLNTFFFNRGFLHSDDNLFFFLDLATSTLALSMKESIYGKYQFVPEDDFAGERGWISAFVMYPYDLLRFTAFACPDDVPTLIEIFRREYAAELASEAISIDQINKRLREVRRAAPRSVRVLRQGFPLWNKARKNLYKLDFTVRDFTLVAQDAFRRWLSGLAVSDPARFETTMRELREKGPGGSQLEAFKKGFDLDLYFEFKIPVALPSEKIRQLGN